MSSSQLRNRKTEKVSEKAAGKVVSSSDISNYDLALRVYMPINQKSKTSSPSALIGIKLLLKVLEVNHFKAAVKPDGVEESVLVLIKLEDQEFEAWFNKAKAIDTLADVSQLTTPDEVTPAQRISLVNSRLSASEAQGGAGITVGLGQWSFIESAVPVTATLNSQKGADVFKKSIFKFFNKEASAAETNFMLKNFGSKYALYFKVVAEYIAFLSLLSLVGCLSQFIFGPLSKVFTFLNLAIGASFYLCWYGSEKKWAQEWNTVNVSHVEIARTENIDPPYKVLLKKALFAPIAVGSSIHLVFYQFVCFLIEIFLTELYQGPGKSLLSLVPTILVCSIVPICTFFYSGVTNQYLHFENNPTKESQDKSYLIKMFVFNFLSSYVPLFITSFVYLPAFYHVNSYLGTIDTFTLDFTNRVKFIPRIPLLTQDYSVNQLRLQTQFTYFILTNQIVGVFMEYGLPFVLTKLSAIKPIGKILGVPAKVQNVKDEQGEKETLDIIREKLSLPVYDINDDYRQFILQFGFMIMFGPTWSASALISLVIELLQVKADFFKIVKLVRTPIAERAESSYPWPMLLKVLLVIGSFTSVCIAYMYNGGDVLAYSDKSSVKATWLYTLPAALLSCIVMQAVLKVGESVIDEYYSEPADKITKKQKHIRSILTTKNEKETPAGNDVTKLTSEAVNLSIATVKK